MTCMNRHKHWRGQSILLDHPGCYNSLTLHVTGAEKVINGGSADMVGAAPAEEVHEA